MSLLIKKQQEALLKNILKEKKYGLSCNCSLNAQRQNILEILDYFFK